MIEHHDVGRDVTDAALRAAPPITVWAFTLNDYVAILTGVYVVLQIGVLLWKNYLIWEDRKKGQGKRKRA